jgi:glycine cleavage system transcriptional repressor
MRRHFALTAVGRDRPGIVAGVTRVLLEAGCNIEDSSMTILRTEFAMILILKGPGELEAAALEKDLSAAVSGVAFFVKELAPEEVHVARTVGQSYIVSVYGADRPGIVHGVARALAERGVNITDLNTRLVGPEDKPVYVMILEADVPPDVPAHELEAELKSVANELGVELSLRPLETHAL